MDLLVKNIFIASAISQVELYASGIFVLGNIPVSLLSHV